MHVFARARACACVCVCEREREREREREELFILMHIFLCGFSVCFIGFLLF